MHCTVKSSHLIPFHITFPAPAVSVHGKEGFCFLSIVTVARRRNWSSDLPDVCVAFSGGLVMGEQTTIFVLTSVVRLTMVDHYFVGQVDSGKTWGNPVAHITPTRDDSNQYLQERRWAGFLLRLCPTADKGEMSISAWTSNERQAPALPHWCDCFDGASATGVRCDLLQVLITQDFAVRMIIMATGHFGPKTLHRPSSRWWWCFVPRCTKAQVADNGVLASPSPLSPTHPPDVSWWY